MDRQPLRVLIVATRHGGCRAQMLAGWLRRFGGERVRVEVGSVQPGDADPLAVRAMYEVGVDIAGWQPDPLVKWLDEPWEVVVLMRDPQKHTRPTLRAAKRVLYYEFPDPAAGLGNEDVVMGHYRSVRDDIHDWSRTFIEKTIGLPRRERQNEPRQNQPRINVDQRG